MKLDFCSLFPHNKFRAPSIWAAAVITLVFASAAVALPSAGGAAAYLDGRWYHDGKPTRILVAPDGRSITITNELGHSTDGYANGPHHLVIPSLGITGEVSRVIRIVCVACPFGAIGPADPASLGVNHTGYA